MRGTSSAPSNGPCERHEITYQFCCLSMANIMGGSSLQHENSQSNCSPEGFSLLQFWDPARLVGCQPCQLALLGMWGKRQAKCFKCRRNISWCDHIIRPYRVTGKSLSCLQSKTRMESTLNAGLKNTKKGKKKKNQLLSQDPRVTAGHLYPMFSTGALTLTPSGVTYSSNEYM